MLAATFLATHLLLAQAPAQATPPAQAAPASAPPKDETKEQKAERQHQQDLKGDEETGKKYAADAEKQYRLSTNKEYQERVQRIGGVIAAIANKTPINVIWGDKRLNPFTYEYKVIQGDDVNAFSIPGGHIYVFEGLVKRVESDDELAGVLAHETTHAEERHVAVLQHEASKIQSFTLPLILLAILTGGASAAVGTLGVTGLYTQAQGSGWSVKAEESADYGGFQYMLKSPYDPTGMLTFMERLARLNQLEDSINWGIYATHPPSRERAETLIDYMNGVQGADPPEQASRRRTARRCRDTVGGGVELVFGGQGPSPPSPGPTPRRAARRRRSGSTRSSTRPPSFSSSRAVRAARSSATGTCCSGWTAPTPRPPTGRPPTSRPRRSGRCSAPSTRPAATSGREPRSFRSAWCGTKGPRPVLRSCDNTLRRKRTAMNSVSTARMKTKSYPPSYPVARRNGALHA